MAALLVTLAVMAVMLTVAMPAWRHEAQREKEAELIWRGEQYARAIALYRAKNQAQNSQLGNQLPPSIDVLVQGRFLRKKYKDPMTKDGEFVLLSQVSQTTPGLPSGGPGRGPGGRSQPQPPGAGAFGAPAAVNPLAIGGIQGVHSKSEEQSIRSYRGATRYDQWLFTFNNVPRPGGAMGGAGGIGPDGRPIQPGANPNIPGGPGNRGNRGGPGGLGGAGGGIGGRPTTPPSQGQPPTGRPPGRGPGGRGM